MFLIGEQEYPSNVLAVKRLMTDCVLVTDAAKHTRQDSGPSGVSFVETTDREHPTCYAYGKSHCGGYRFCPNVTKEVQERTIKAVCAGHFD